MGFDNLAPQEPIYPAEAAGYAAEALRRSRDAASLTRHVADIAYGADPTQRLDIYLPERAPPRPAPVLLFAHGGAWTHGYKEWMALMAPALVSLPALFVSVDYRLAPTHRHPAGMDDCRAALRWVHANIARYGGDPERLFVGGHSAGGHLYALVALRRDLLARDGLPDDVVKACFPVSAQLDLVFADPAPGSAEERIERLFLVRREDAAAASPTRLLGGNRTPFLIAHGEHDFPRIIRSNAAMIDALRREASPFEAQVFPGDDHFTAALALASAEHPWVRTVRSWMAEGPPGGA